MTPAAAGETKAALFEQLRKAMLLELSTLPPYLTALWSIHPNTNHEAAVVIRSVLMEEMLHMTLAGNVLSAVGGTPNLGAGSIPVYPLQLDFKSATEGDRVLEINLAPFSPSTMRTFLQIELPANMVSPTGAAMNPELVVTGFTIGQFYAVIRDALRALSDTLGERALFSGNPAHQISEELYWKGGGHPIVVTNLATALEAIDVITEQGEGADSSLFDGDRHFFGQPDEVAHYFRFNQIITGRYYAPTDSIYGDPTGRVLPVDFNAVYPIKPNCRHSDFATDAKLTAMSAKFNAGYSMMLSQLMEGFCGNPAVFYTAIKNGMSGLTDVARAMMQIPIPGDEQRRNATPTFEWNSALIGGSPQ